MRLCLFAEMKRLSRNAERFFARAHFLGSSSVCDTRRRNRQEKYLVLYVTQVRLAYFVLRTILAFIESSQSNQRHSSLQTSLQIRIDLIISTMKTVINCFHRLTLLPSRATGKRKKISSSPAEKKDTEGSKEPSVSLANNYKFDTNVRCGILYESASPNKTGFITLSIVAYPTIFAPSWILIFLPTHRQCG